jgi:hypothetical protein
MERRQSKQGQGLYLNNLTRKGLYLNKERPLSKQGTCLDRGLSFFFFETMQIEGLKARRLEGLKALRPEGLMA